MSLFSEIEKTIERGFRQFTDRMFGAAQSGELVVVHHAILEEIESKVQTVARGRRIFPFAHLGITLHAGDAAQRELLAGAFGERRLEADIREALAGAGCEIPRGFSVEILTSDAREDGAAFSILYRVQPVQAAVAPKTEPAGRLVIVTGKAERDEYVLERARTNVGRTQELTDSDHRVIRRNDIVFEDGASEANATVSRKHAHIKLEGGEYRICDDESEFGTRVFRDGRPIEVPAGNRRGERLRSGDEIYLGRACLRFER
jgi:hypothetical protein